MAPEPCGAVAACDQAAQACIGASSLGRLSVGYEEVCAIDDQRNVACWGYNGGGALVLSDDRTVLGTPTPVSGVAGVRQISLGSSQKCALEDDGSVWCWGGNSDYELGNTDPSIQAPAQVMGLPPSVEVRAGDGCTCARLTDGTVDCWGDGGGPGCLGTGMPPMMGAPPGPAWWYPSAMAGISGAVQLVASGGDIFCARISSPPDVTVTCWSEGVDPSPIPTVTDAIDVATGEGAVFVHSKTMGLLVSTRTADKVHWTTPVAWAYPNVGSLAEIAAGHAYCGVQGGASVDKGQSVACLALNNGPPFSAPTAVSLPFKTGTIAEIAVGKGSPVRYDLAVACLRLDGASISGNVYCWGDDASGALGIGAPEYYPSPVSVPGISGAVGTSLWTSNYSTSVVLGTGEIRLWGDTALLGQEPSAPTDDLTPIFGTDNVKVRYNDDSQYGYVLKSSGPPQVYLGGTEMTGRLVTSMYGDYVDMYPYGEWDLGLRMGGQVTAFGDDNGGSDDPNGYGIFGNGTFKSTSPQIGVVGTSFLASAIAAQGYDYYGDASGHACAIDGSKAAQCWGKNAAGEVGNGDTSGNPVATPTPVKNIADPVQSIAAGQDFSCAVTTTNKVYCWGANDSDQLGYTGQPVAAARQITTIPPATAVVAHDEHACALLVSGSVWCWGDNSAGQAGNGTLHSTAAPGLVTGLGSDVVAISTSSGQTCAVHTGGTVSCWGASDSGQVGLGVTEEFDAAQQVQSL